MGRRTEIQYGIKGLIHHEDIRTVDMSTTTGCKRGQIYPQKGKGSEAIVGASGDSAHVEKDADDVIRIITLNDPNINKLNAAIKQGFLNFLLSDIVTI